MFKRLTVPTEPINDDEALHQMWLSLRDPWHQSRSRIRFVLLDSQRIPRPYPIEIDVMEHPEIDRLVMILDVLTDMIEELTPEGSLAVQYVSADAQPNDRAIEPWLELITEELEKGSLSAWPVYVSNGTAVWRTDRCVAVNASESP